MPNKISFDEITQAEPPKTSRIDFDEVLGSAPTVQTGQTRAGPTYGPEIKPGSGNFVASLKSDLVEDPDTKLRLAADTLFPNDPKGKDRLGMVGGRLVMVNEKGELQYVSGRGTEFGANVVANTPEIVGGAVGSFASPVIGSTAGTVGARGIKRAVAGMVFNEPQTIEGNLKDLAIEGGLNAVTAGAGKAGVLLGNRGRKVDFTPANLQRAEAVQQNVKNKFGIDLNLAQASEDPRLIAMWEFLAQQPTKSAEVVKIAQETSEGQLDSAVQRFLDYVAKAEPSEIAGQSAIDVAQASIAKAKRAASQKVSPLYEAAYESKTEITNPRLKGLLKLPHFQDALKRANRMAELEGRPIADGKAFDLRTLDYVKQGLDDVIETLQRRGSNKEARALIERKNEMVKFLDNVSDDKYKKARGAWAKEMQENVEPLEQGIIGVIAKTQSSKAATLALKVMRDENVTPQQIAKARGTFLQQEGGLEAWNGGVVRQYLSKSWNDANRVAQGGDVINPAGKMQQNVAKTPNDKAKLVAALGGSEKAELADELLDTMRRMASTYSRNSNTQSKQQLEAIFRGPLGRFIRVVGSPVKSAMDAADQRVFDDMTGKVAEALANPRKVDQLKQVVKMSPSVRQATVLGTILFGQTAQAGFPISPEDQMPKYVSTGGRSYKRAE